MYKKFIATAVFAVMLMTVGTKAMAAGIGYINLAKVQENYALAKAAMKQVDAESLKLQQYLIDQEKQYKALDTPLKKKNFEEKTSKAFKAKEQAYLELKLKKEEEVFKNIQTAAKQVLIEQKLDAIVDYRIIFVGGVDITDLVIQKLKN